jgi:hypothetical protein
MWCGEKYSHVESVKLESSIEDPDLIRKDTLTYVVLEQRSVRGVDIVLGTGIAVYALCWLARP